MCYSRSRGCDHDLCKPVPETWHVALADSELEGSVGGDVHREDENEDHTIDSWVLSGPLLRCSLT